jgi:hypothetical protein
MGRSRRRTVASSRRQRPFRTPNKIFLIVCEGKKTEPTYFGDLRKAKRLSGAHIKVVPGNIAGTTPKKLVEYARNELNGSATKFDEVWCVFDRDDHSTIAEAKDMAEANGIKLAFSNPSFELWYLLHFTDHTSHKHRDEVVRMLKDFIPVYVKSMPGVYTELKDKQTDAIRRAKGLRRYHRKNYEPTTKNPSTTVDCLVVELENLEIT